VLNIGITLKKRTIYAPVVISVALAVNIALNFLLIPRYQAMGATISTLISYIVFCALRYWASNMFFKVRYEWGRVFTLLGVGTALIAAFYISDHLRGETLNRTTLFLSLVIKALLALSFPLLLFALRFYDERERRRIAEIWSKVPVIFRRRRFNEGVMILIVSVGAILLVSCLMIMAASHPG
jgi:peptidoglycan biosynthesis protein MviN/MurJ (putative lipid II flippase)